MEQCLPVSIDYIAHQNILIIPQTAHELSLVVVLDQIGALLMQFSRPGIDFACLHKVCQVVTACLKGLFIDLDLDSLLSDSCRPDIVWRTRACRGLRITILEVLLFRCHHSATLAVVIVFEYGVLLDSLAINPFKAEILLICTTYERHVKLVVAHIVFIRIVN